LVSCPMGTNCQNKTHYQHCFRYAADPLNPATITSFEIIATNRYWGCDYLGDGWIGWDTVPDSWQKIPLSATRPTLKLSKSGDVLNLTWTPPATNYAVESAATLSGTWTTISGAINGMQVVPIGNKFYRLKLKP